ncbi:MAG TPA: NAD(P)H-dependent glycerol-3-phosphate dehydrogenase [Planctomycetaceae bacterium]|nr:NAD(P)H-dependent glycerol-3-phosphate dehydrogenase [Planctomycetaceae bacterium]
MAAKVTVLGGGAMGTGCSILLAERPERHVALWVRTPAAAAEIAATRENLRLLPGIRIPEQIDVTADIAAAANGADLLVAAIPTAYLRAALSSIAGALPQGVPVVSVVKGIENGTFFTPSRIIREVLGPRDVVALCGPSHAEEFARRLPASVVVAGDNDRLLREVQDLFTTDRFRVYTNRDLVGVELASALKNVIAIAAGICDGLAYGDNAKAALLTRGIVEITRFGVALGAEPETFAGLAGIGDLITTCFSGYGRNRRVGERLGQGARLAEILLEIHGVPEGVATCKSVYDQSRERGIDMPICTEVYRVLFENKSPVAATDSLMLRPLRAETRTV